MSSNTYDIKRYCAGNEMWRVIYVRRLNICLNAACRRWEEELHTARGLPPGPLKLGARHRGENTVSKKGPGSLPCTDHWITFSLSYSSQGHMSSAHCAAGDLTARPVSFSAAVTYTSHINEDSEDRQYLSHRAISTTFTGQRAYCLAEHFSVETHNLSCAVALKQNPSFSDQTLLFCDVDSWWRQHH